MNKNCVNCENKFEKIHKNDVLCNKCLEDYKINEENKELIIRIDLYKLEQYERFRNNEKMEEMIKSYLTLSSENKEKFKKLIN